jgi:dolichyl-phosphate-mannose-protein mannosyltransferase
VTATAEASVKAADLVADDSATSVEAAAGRPPVPEQLVGWRDPSPRIGWIITAAVTGIAALTRLWALDWPKGKMFDEIYYATEAQELLRYGYEDNRGYMFVVHPPLGKWLIAGTSAIFGNNEVGWRLAPALAGIVSVLLLVRIARRIFRSNVFAGIAGLLLALDGLSVVQSRVALLDIFLQLFIVAGFGALVLDREQMRSRLAGLLAEGVDLSDGIPTLGPRPWRLAAGVLLGLACAVKWSALSFFVLFALLSLMWDRGALKSAGVTRSWRWAARKSWLPGIGSLVVAPTAAYLFTWLGWFAGENSWNRHWADSHPSATRLDILGIRIPFNWGFLPAGIRSLGDYHLNAYRFHEGLDSPHAYGSKPWSWLILGRPVSFYYQGDGVRGCGATDCSRAVLDIGTPVLWWAFIPALVWLVWRWLTSRDWRAAAILVAFVAGWVVWLQDPKRTMFLFYMTPLVPFLALGVTMGLGAILGPAVRPGVDASDRASILAERRRKWGVFGISAYLGLLIVDFAWMWPLFSGGLLTYEQWHMHMWFPSWI